MGKDNVRSPAQPSGSPDAAGLGVSRLQVRPAPRFAAFMTAGAVVGAVAALLMAFVPDGEYAFGSVFGFFLIAFGAAGLVGGALVALFFDKVSRRRTRVLLSEQLPEKSASNSQGEL